MFNVFTRHVTTGDVIPSPDSYRDCADWKGLRGPMKRIAFRDSASW
jgi:hypothetical protein